jgi:hypothetical protein
MAAGRRADAREAIAALLEDGARLPADTDRLVVLALTAEMSARLGDLDAAARLAAELVPFAGRFVLVDRAWAVWGTTSRVLAIVAAAQGETGAAEHHFDAARSIEATGARGWLALTLSDRAEMLRR